MTPEVFFSEPQTLDAVAYNFIIIGEAARHIPLEVEARYPQVAWKEMRDMRNFLVHEYPGTDSEIVWKTLVSDLPPLVPQLERIHDIEGYTQAGRDDFFNRKIVQDATLRGLQVMGEAAKKVPESYRRAHPELP